MPSPDIGTVVADVSDTVLVGIPRHGALGRPEFPRVRNAVVVVVVPIGERSVVQQIIPIAILGVEFPIEPGSRLVASGAQSGIRGAGNADVLTGIDDAVLV